ncbi:TonB-dependent receptor [Aliiglaciecola sp. 2_MG-2023]|uniref:TonB-dependent receptor plug domain-containing protein n=1 Tax=unclassified Aliiglaciecola TaxID=2593648 RepID=UPI0026E38BB3|nr:MULTISPECIES: TonB-dependent receptor [unclassified Aliiglaciecola]MDO6711689.1 TonB-dependent receptor [Aliiglaciecola sp. 2_MG-2023]MDO6752760.1 TonB-dependent receptor [Aliiglaciecola sp. 1_MG-2023]
MKTTKILTTKKLLAISITAALAFSASAQQNTSSEDEPEKIQVTGSYIKRTSVDAAEPVQVLDYNYIQSTGATTVSELIGKLAISSGAENQADSFSQAASQGTGNVNLRGLGLSSTLVLINGRRQTISGALTNDGSVFVDTSHIPIDAIEQVEVLKEGAASTYGSDAIAGVVNFILRKDFEGFEINASISKADDSSQKDTDIGFLWGAEFDNTSIVVSGHYLDRTPLTIADRPELGDVAFSSLGNSFLLLADAEVADGPYAGSYGAYENVPDPTCLDDTLGMIIPQAYGSRCGFNYGPLYNLVNTETRAQLYSNISHDFDNGIALSADLSWSSNEVKDNPQSPSYPDLTFPYIGPTDSGNPFGVGVVWLGRPLGADYEPALSPRENDTFRTSLSLVGDFDNGWSWDTALTYSKNNYKQYQQDQLKSRLVAALAGVGGPNNDELFNPFDRSSLSQSVIDDFTYMTESEKTTDLLVLDAVVSGDLYEVSAGTIGFAAGIQARTESFKVETDDVNEIKFDDQGNPIPVDLIFLQGLSEVDADKNTFALFAESVIPVTEDIEIKAALRYEKLENDSSVDPKIAVRWQISDQWIMRASASTAFRDASLSQKNASSAVITSITDYNDDGTAKSSAFVGVIATGNEDLKPEESDNYNIGLIFKPTDNLDFKVDFWRVDYTNLITVENAQGKLIDDPNGVDIIRTDAGFLSSVKVNYFNSSSVSVEGIDFESTWTLSDQFNISLNASHFNSYELTKDNGEVVEAAGSFNIDNFARSMPETKGSVNFNWLGESQRASINVNYVSSYDTGVDVSALPNESSTVDAFTTVDMQYSANFYITDDSEAILTLGVKNLLNEMPPRAYIAEGSLSYDPKQHNPLGRVLYAKVKLAF